jgi:hypothetical protein
VAWAPLLEKLPISTQLQLSALNTGGREAETVFEHRKQVQGSTTSSWWCDSMKMLCSGIDILLKSLDRKCQRLVLGQCGVHGGVAIRGLLSQKRRAHNKNRLGICARVQ